MQRLDWTLPSPAENLALDEALLLRAEANGGPAVVRFWEWPQPCVVLGAGGRTMDEADVVQCDADDVPILRRSSGGGTVLLGSGCLCFTLVLALDFAPALREIASSYRFIMERLAAALRRIHPGIAWCGISDLACQGRKFSGNAQQRKRAFLMHHGTLMYNLDIAGVSRYLRPPPREPSYRSGRPHQDFLCNLPTDAATLRACVLTAFPADEPLTDWPRDRVRQLVAEQYGNDAWNRRR